MSAEAQTQDSWLGRWMVDFDWQHDSERAGSELTKAVASLPEAQRVQVLTEAVGRLPGLRARWKEPLVYAHGAAIYWLVCELYGTKLAMTEDAVCALLESSRHGCGHGSDVKPPFENAVAWAREHGVTDRWLSALQSFVDGLHGVRSAQAHNLKVKGGLLLLMAPPQAKAPKCWSERFRLGLRSAPEPTRRAWQRLVLFMGTTIGGKRPKAFDGEARVLVETLGAEAVLGALSEWLPDPAVQLPWRAGIPGSHLLKNLVWLLTVMVPDEAPSHPADALAERLTRVELSPKEPSKKAAAALADYFVRRPPSVAHARLLRLLALSTGFSKEAYDNERIPELVANYERAHGLSRTAAAGARRPDPARLQASPVGLLKRLARRLRG